MGIDDVAVFEILPYNFWTRNSTRGSVVMNIFLPSLVEAGAFHGTSTFVANEGKNLSFVILITHSK